MIKLNNTSIKSLTHGEIDKVDLIKNFTSLPKKFKEDRNTNERLEENIFKLRV